MILSDQIIFILESRSANKIVKRRHFRNERSYDCPDCCHGKFILDFFRANTGKIFDADIVSTILDIKVLQESKRSELPEIMDMGIRELRDGMELAENIVTINNLLILTKGEILDNIKIRRIMKFRNSYGISGDTVKVKRS